MRSRCHCRYHICIVSVIFFHSSFSSTEFVNGLQCIPFERNIKKFTTKAKMKSAYAKKICNARID